MTKLSKIRLQQILAEELQLKDPRFRLSRPGARWNGAVISQTFFRKGDGQRQGMIWDALDRVLGIQAEDLVGMLIAYTPFEWELQDPLPPPPKAASPKSTHANGMPRKPTPPKRRAARRVA